MSGDHDRTDCASTSAHGDIDDNDEESESLGL